MSTFTGLVRLFSRRTARVLSSKNVANTFQSSCRARSIFAATTRGASQNLRYAIPCACTKVCACEVHKYTQADSELMNFLKQEIQHERDNASKVSPSTLFQTKVDGTQVSMEREHNGERIVLSFDLNENINQDEGGADVDAGSDDEEAFLGKIVSYPSFTVEITKKTGHTLKFYCEFNSDLGEDYLSDSEVEGERAAPEMVHIINVSVMDSPNRDKEKTIYCAETENMDSNLYVMLLNMLAERGVNNDFCQWLLDYSTSLEQQHYIKFLEDLQGFVKLQ